MGIRAVLFDLDGTLWRPLATPDWSEVTRVQAAAIEPLLAPYGLSGDGLIRAVATFWSMFDEAHPLPPPGGAEARWTGGPAIVREMLAQHGVELSAGDETPVWETLHSVPMRHFNIEAFDDAAETVARLRASGRRLAIVTGRPLGEKIVRAQMVEFGLPAVFDAVVTSGEIGYAKPHQAVFEQALSRLGVSGAESMMVGDRCDDDMEPAARLGMTGVLLRDRRAAARCGAATYEVASLSGLFDLEPLRDAG